jgi:hypothetical protein
LVSFHVSFDKLVIDRDPTVQVWNHPVRSFRVMNRRPLSNFEAAQKIHPSLRNYRALNPYAHSFVYYYIHLLYVGDDVYHDDYALVKSNKVNDPSYTYTMPLEYVLELDGQGNMIGGDWVGASYL